VSFAASATSGGLPPTLDNASPNQDWRSVPVKRESAFTSWVDSFPPSKNIEDRRGRKEGENDLGIVEATEKRMDRIPTDEEIMRTQRADRSSRDEDLDEANLQKAGPRSRMIKDKVPLPRPRPGSRQPMIYK
jgi:hypothetical protein